jgi:hypothetical protein
MVRPSVGRSGRTAAGDDWDRCRPIWLCFARHRPCVVVNFANCRWHPDSVCTSIVVTKILKYRNTQAATGVLFAALILVFMGEMAAALLERDLRIPY